MVTFTFLEHRDHGGPGNPPLGLVNVDLFLKVLLTSATESVITQSSGTAGAVMHGSVLLASKRA